MALFNHATKELTAKIVFYGPGLCGKTTNLKILHQRLERGAGKLLSLSTAQDRTIYFDLLPIELGNIKGYTVRFQVCTVPGQVFYNETRRIVLRGVDGLVFVVDSQWSMLSHNLESFQNLRENLSEEKVPLESLPVVIQYNKRDLPSALSVEALQESLGFQSYPYVEAVASEGMGVLETFKLASKLTFVDLLRRLQRGWQPPLDADARSAESSLGSSSQTVGSSSGTGGATQPFAGPAVSISAPAPEPEDQPAAAPVLAMAGESGATAEEEPAEWVPPSAEGTFADLSDDSQKNAASPARLEGSAVAPPPPAVRRVSSPEARLGALPGTSGERRALRTETTAPVTPLDNKLNAVLAEARRAATGRSGTFKRDDVVPSDAGKADVKRVEALEKALEAERDERQRLASELEAERDERRQLATTLGAEKTTREVAALRASEALETVKSGSADATARANEAHEAIAALKAELAEAREALRAAREAVETVAREASAAVAERLALAEGRGRGQPPRPRRGDRRRAGDAGEQRGRGARGDRGPRGSGREPDRAAPGGEDRDGRVPRVGGSGRRARAPARGRPALGPARSLVLGGLHGLQERRRLARELRAADLLDRPREVQHLVLSQTHELAGRLVDEGARPLLVRREAARATAGHAHERREVNSREDRRDVARRAGAQGRRHLHEETRRREVQQVDRHRRLDLGPCALRKRKTRRTPLVLPARFLPWCRQKESSPGSLTARAVPRQRSACKGREKTRILAPAGTRRHR